MLKKLMLFSMLFVPCLAFAQAAGAPAPVAIPSWIVDVLTWLQAVPKIGPIVVAVVSVLGIVASVMTVLSTFLLGIKASIQGVASLAGLSSFIDKVEAIYQKIAPYFQYLSMYNAQKSQAVASTVATPAASPDTK